MPSSLIYVLLQILLLRGNWNTLTFLSQSSTSTFPSSTGRGQGLFHWILDKTMGLLVCKCWCDRYKNTLWWTVGAESPSACSLMHMCVVNTVASSPNHLSYYFLSLSLSFFFSQTVCSCVWFSSEAPLWSTYSVRELITSHNAFHVAGQLLVIQNFPFLPGVLAGLELRLG